MTRTGGCFYAAARSDAGTAWVHRTGPTGNKAHRTGVDDRFLPVGVKRRGEVVGVVPEGTRWVGQPGKDERPGSMEPLSAWPLPGLRRRSRDGRRRSRHTRPGHAPDNGPIADRLGHGRRASRSRGNSRGPWRGARPGAMSGEAAGAGRTTRCWRQSLAAAATAAGIRLERCARGIAWRHSRSNRSPVAMPMDSRWAAGNAMGMRAIFRPC